MSPRRPTSLLRRFGGRAVWAHSFSPSDSITSMGWTVPVLQTQEATGVVEQHFTLDFRRRFVQTERFDPFAIRDERVVGAEEGAILQRTEDRSRQLGRPAA